MIWLLNELSGRAFEGSERKTRGFLVEERGFGNSEGSKLNLKRIQTESKTKSKTKSKREPPKQKQKFNRPYHRFRRDCAIESGKRHRPAKPSSESAAWTWSYHWTPRSRSRSRWAGRRWRRWTGSRSPLGRSVRSIGGTAVEGRFEKIRKRFEKISVIMIRLFWIDCYGYWWLPLAVKATICMVWIVYHCKRRELRANCKRTSND